MNDGENSIKAQRCIFHSTNKDNRNQNVVCCVCSSTFIRHCYKLLVQVHQFVTNPKLSKIPQNRCWLIISGSILYLTCEL